MARLDARLATISLVVAASCTIRALGSIKPSASVSSTSHRAHTQQQRHVFAGMQHKQAPAGVDAQMGPGPQFLLEDGAEERDRVPIPRYTQNYYVGPTAQPASRGQDEQECGFTTLPEKFRLVPRVQDEMTRMGFFETDQGATLVQWTQSLFGWAYQNIFFNIDDKAFIKVEVLDNDGVDALYDELAEEGIETPISNADFNTIVIKDCQDVLLYIFREHRQNINIYEVYNRAFQFLAGSVEGINYQDQIHFYDEHRAPIAIAQSPFVTTMAATTIYKPPDGQVKQWEIEYVGGDMGSNSSLVGEEYRWVLATAVQVRAIREATWANGSPEEPGVYSWFLFTWFLVFSLVVLLGCYLLRFMYFLVYPREMQPAITNPFMKDFRAYGVLEDPEVQRRRGAA